jgi:hypothetical protein
LWQSFKKQKQDVQRGAQIEGLLLRGIVFFFHLLVDDLKRLLLDLEPGRLALGFSENLLEPGLVLNGVDGDGDGGAS